MWGAGDLQPWTWLILGLVLIGLETLAPGVFLFWLGIAAVLTGLLDYGLGLSWQAAFVAFAALSLASVLTGRALTRRGGGADGPALNRRGEALVGRRFRLDEPIVAGEGRIRLDDTVWRVVGPDLPAGAEIRVSRLDGATLVVEPA
ncbi:NfeD family protein [Enterovirga aerilata]|uniref:NfeD family protein n=1 Tax=Enterovirga aerilata TaxID=2730920 RepID=A0A849I4R0_9HYPH|nr:NfeD family protein [Enterovirga sp. DB1703]NNM71047.1 NfeD family protein [Enterovirga sp. DB1703]